MRTARLWPLLCLALTACEGADTNGERVHQGDALINNLADAARLKGVHRITGDLIVRPGIALRDLVLPDVAVVEGRVLVEGTGEKIESGRVVLSDLLRVGLDLAITRTSGQMVVQAPALRMIAGHLDAFELDTLDLALPVLELVNGDVRLRDARLAALSLPALKRVGGSWRFERYAGGAAGAASNVLPLGTPQLETVAGDVRFRLGAETTWDAPLLAGIGGDFEIGALRFRLRLPALATLGGSLRASRANLIDFALPALRTIGTDLALTGLTLEGTDHLAFPALTQVGAQIEIDEVGNLRELTLAALTRLGARVRLARAPTLQKVTIGAAVELPSDIEVVGCAGPLTMAFPDLVRLGGGLILLDAGDVSLSFPRLQVVTGGLRLTETTLRAFEAPLLARVDQSVELRAVAGHNLRVFGLPALKTIGAHLVFERTRFFEELALPALTSIGNTAGGVPSGDLRVIANEVLRILDIGALQRVEANLLVQRNAAIPSTAINAILAPVVVGGQRVVCDNGDGESACP